MREAGKVIVFDFSKLGYLSTTAHGHADALSLWISLDGLPILIDSGTFAYQEAGLWRDYFRSTRAHNTLVVDGKDQSQMAGTFLWSETAQTRLDYWLSTPEYDCVIASHDGYKGIGVRHQRTVIYLKPDALFVLDDLLGTGEHTISQYWHFPHHAQIDQKGKSFRVSAGSVKVDFHSLTEISG